MMHDIFRVDREHVLVKEGLVVVAAIMVGALVEALLGEVAIYTVAAAYFVSRVGVHERGRQRWRYMFVATVIGVTVSALAVLVGDNTLRAVVLWSATIYLTGLALAYGTSAFYAGYFLVFWVLFAMLTASRSPGEEVDAAVSFLLGGAVAIVIMAIRSRLGWIDETDIEPASIPTPTMKQAAQSDVGIFAVLWAVTMAVAIGIGYTFFPSNHSGWHPRSSWSCNPTWPKASGRASSEDSARQSAG